MYMLQYKKEQMHLYSIPQAVKNNVIAMNSCITDYLIRYQHTAQGLPEQAIKQTLHDWLDAHTF